MPALRVDPHWRELGGAAELTGKWVNVAKNACKPLALWFCEGDGAARKGLIFAIGPKSARSIYKWHDRC